MRDSRGSQDVPEKTPYDLSLIPKHMNQDERNTRITKIAAITNTATSETSTKS